MSTPPTGAATAPSGQPSQSRPSSGGPSGSNPPPSQSDANKHPARGSQPLIVLNNTSTANLAQQAAQQFEGGGWNVSSYDENYDNVIASTVVYYDPDVHGAKHAAHALQRQFPQIKRVAPRFAPAAGGDPLPDGPEVVVLTSDYNPG